MLAFTAPAQAATQINLQGGSGFAGTFTGRVLNAGTFSQIFTFELPRAGTTAAAVITIAADAQSNINFTSVTLNDQQFTLSPSGFVESGSIMLKTMAGTQTIVVSGTSGGTASYGGSIAFSAMGVPEPSTWACLILGFGVLGSTMRRRRAARAPDYA